MPLQVTGILIASVPITPSVPEHLVRFIASPVSVIERLPLPERVVVKDDPKK